MVRLLRTWRMTFHQIDGHSPDLTDRVLSCQRTGSRATELRPGPSVYVYHYPRRKNLSLFENDGGDFLRELV